ncbi:hypothetical protein [Asanoa siamensis]|uniref:Transcriptional regulator, AbiEi antitoxin, Type IV TA system n=1 Tax=Asanoa siamensis TaxID=926357 RepID=A0ABQ4D0K9_9ACTN|nr:hypothetical protein [Asanoa siamensis]GIF77083.1 hypothetical protein Asi02nite_66010 [Asanoa siamensis]
MSTHRPAALEWRVFRGSAAVAAGLLSVHQLRGRGWVRLRHDVYADARLPRDHGLLCRATLARLPPSSAVLAGPSAAYAHGIHEAAAAADPVHLILARGQRVGGQAGTRVHRVALDPVDVGWVRLVGGCGPLGDGDVGQGGDGGDGGGPGGGDGGGPGGGGAGDGGRSGECEVAATLPARTAWDVAVWLPLPAAVAVVDALLYQGLVTPAALVAVRDRLSDRPGGRRAGHTLALTDGDARSRAESLLRVRLYLAGLPMAVARPPGFAAAPPLAWPDFRVALWGAADPVGEALMVDDGWFVLRTSARREFAEVVREVRVALLARGWRTRRKQDVMESALTPTIR